MGSGKTPNSMNIYRSFEDARGFVRKLNLKSQSEWKEYAKEGGEKPSDIPYKPQRIYKDKGWVGIKDFLGKEK